MGSLKKSSGFIGRVGLALVVAVGLASVPTRSKPDIPTGKIPSGFKVVTKVDTPVQISVAADKPNSVKACVYVDPDIHLAYSWTGMADSAAEMVAKSMIAQEEQSSDVSGIKTVPIGKEGLKNGTLIFKKTSMKQTETNCPDWVTYTGTWAAPVGDGVLIISVSNVAGSKDAVKGWIEAMIP